MDDLVRRLSTGTHTIIASRSKSPQDLRQVIDAGYVLLKFPETQGGTELGMKLEKNRCVLGDADFESGKGVIQLVGHLTVNYDKVELSAEIDLATLQGQGSLRLIEEESVWRARQAEVQDADMPLPR